MTLVGASDLWLFISSTGGVTAGREEADRALFPYATEDKVAAGAGRTGGLTLLRVATPTAPCSGSRSRRAGRATRTSSATSTRTRSARRSCSRRPGPTWACACA